MTASIQAKPAAVEKVRIGGLDSIRFICALTVAINHFGALLPKEWFGADPGILGKIGWLLSAYTTNGPVGVIVFFVISGFCIHYPQATTQRVALPQYYCRRLIRICIPALVAIGVWHAVGLAIEWPDCDIFWSVVCEIIYYLGYPLLLLLRRRFGWGPMIALSYLAAYALLFGNLDLVKAARNGYAAFGVFNWVLGLPCWLLGCWLAENFHRFPAWPEKCGASAAECWRSPPG